MSDMIKYALYKNLMALFCFIMAGVVASTGNDGWGWLIFGGFCFMTSIESNEKEDSNAGTEN